MSFRWLPRSARTAIGSKTCVLRRFTMKTASLKLTAGGILDEGRLGEVRIAKLPAKSGAISD